VSLRRRDNGCLDVRFSVRFAYKSGVSIICPFFGALLFSIPSATAIFDDSLTESLEHQIGHDIGWVSDSASDLLII
jgi:hypothetical protein